LMISPSLTYQLNPKLSMAFGVDYALAKLTLSKYSYSNKLLYTHKLHDWDAWGWHFGALYHFNAKTTIGLRFNSSVKLKMAGSLSPAYQGYDAASSELSSPEVIVFSVKHELDKKNTFLFDLQLTNWSRFDYLDLVDKATGSSDLTTSYEYNYNDSWRCALGYSYDLTAGLKIRVGTAYDQTPTSDTFRKANIPDDSRSWLSFGFTQDTSGGSFDFGYAFVKMAKAKLNQTESLVTGSVSSTLTGSYSSHVHIMGMQWNKSWK
jgi:long-chain fatty acid transport protein